MAATALRLEMICGTFSQGSSCLATLGFGPESRWDSPRAGTAKAGSGPGQGKGTHHPHLCQPNRVSHVSGSDRLGMTEPKISESAFTP